MYALGRFVGAIGAGLLAIAGAGLAILIGWGIYDAVTAETFALRKDTWTCTASHEETQTITTNMIVGKVIVPQIITQVVTVCDRYERKGATHGE